MKKQILLSIAVGLILLLSGCSKNYAEIYEGSYSLTVNIQMTTEVPGFGSFYKDTVINSSMNITPRGDDGEVNVTGYYNTIGYADASGLHLNPSNITFNGNGEAVNTVISHSTITEPHKRCLKWSSSMAGFGASAIQNGNITGSIENTAKLNK